MKFVRPERRLVGVLDRAPRNEMRFYSNRFCDEKLVQPAKPAFSDQPNERAVTTFRPLPTKYHADPDLWSPWRFDPTTLGMAYGGWMKVVEMWCSKRHTFYISDTGDPEFDRENDPAWFVSSELNRAVKKGGGPDIIVDLMKGGAGRSAQVEGRRSIALIQGLLLERGMDEKKQNPRYFDPPLGLGPDQPLFLLYLTHGGKMELVNYLQTLAPDVDAEDVMGMTDENVEDPSEWTELFAHGDPVHIQNGAFLRFFPKNGIDPREEEYLDTLTGAQRKEYLAKKRREAEARRQFGGGDKENPFDKGYTVFHSREEFNGFSPDLSEYEDVLKEKVHSWDEVLITPSDEKRVEYIVDSLRWRDPNDKSNNPGELLVDVVEWVFQQRPDLLSALPDRLADELAGRKRYAPGGRPALDGSDDGVRDERDASADDRRPRRGVAARAEAEPDPEPEPEPEPTPTPQPVRRPPAPRRAAVAAAAAAPKADPGLAKARAAAAQPEPDPDEDYAAEAEDLTEEPTTPKPAPAPAAPVRTPTAAERLRAAQNLRRNQSA